MTIQPICELPQLPRRSSGGHKGTYGTVLVIAGSRGMSGAAVLVGRGALRGGAGLVRVACPTAIQDIVAASYPSYTTVGIADKAQAAFDEQDAQSVLELAREVDVVALGPGLSQGPGLSGFVRSIVQQASAVPLVLDADGLNAVAPLAAGFSQRSAPLVLTPHPGEFARLVGRGVPEIEANREALAVEWAGRWNAIVLLKGVNTLVTDGTRLYRNSTGNPGMATGGSGDVLTGVIAALIGQGLAAFDAAVLGSWVHGRAGDAAARKLGQTSMTSLDLLESLPEAFRQLESSW